MRCVVSAAGSAACSAVLLLSAVIITGSGGTAHAQEPEPAAATAPGWCVARGGERPDCVHADVVTCNLAALFSGGMCVREEPAPAPVVAAAPPAPKRTAPRRKASVSQQDELFREFERWKRTSTQ